MQIPAAGFIEIAVDQLKKIPESQIQAQLAELHEVHGSSLDTGYNLGLQVARVMLASNTELALKGINPDDLL
jgi:hypothetical protein